MYSVTANGSLFPLPLLPKIKGRKIRSIYREYAVIKDNKSQRGGGGGKEYRYVSIFIE